MRILFVVANPPSALRVRPFQMIRSLAAYGGQVSVATAYRDAREHAVVQALASHGLDVLSRRLRRTRRALNLLGALAQGAPLQANYAWQPGLCREATASIAGAHRNGPAYDVAHVEHLRGSRYALELRPHLPVVWDSVDCISTLFEQALRHSRSLRGRLMARLDLSRTRRYEGWLVRQFDAVVVTSDADRQALLWLAARALGGEGESTQGGVSQRGGESSTRREPAAGCGVTLDITVVPNGVDLEYFAPSTAARDADTVLMTGKMSYHANVTAALYLLDDIMPLVWAERPAARVVLAGAEPSLEVRALARRDSDRVSVTGYVEDLRPYLRRATVSVAPIVYGVGIQNKVLEAMATATPVVATAPAARALSAVARRDIVLGESPEGLARAILDLLADPDRATRIGAAGRAYVERHHRWEDAAAKLVTVYERAIERFKERTS